MSTTFTILTGLSGTLSIEGYNFNHLDNIILSASNIDLLSGTQFFNPVSGTPSLSSSYPGVSGINYTIVDVINDNKINITVGPYLSATYLNFILTNKAGYYQTINNTTIQVVTAQV